MIKEWEWHEKKLLLFVRGSESGTYCILIIK